MKLALMTHELTPREYDLFRDFIFRVSGINLGAHKAQLVCSRLGRHVRRKGFASFREYYEHVRRDESGEALCELLDSITTNTTHLFREPRHFARLSDIVAGWAGDPAWRRRHDSLRIWSAAASTGEEPYSIGMTVYDIANRAGLPVRILATDLSTRALQQARGASFDAARVASVPRCYRDRFFEPLGEGPDAGLRVSGAIRRMIAFSQFNLMSDPFPFRHGFDVIFCRNVMIYFDKATRETLVNKMADQLHEGGYLLIGHSESLNGIRHPLAYVEPTIYQKK